MLAVLVNNVLAIPSSHKNTLAAKTDSLVLSNGGPCTVNRETNCVCSSNFNTDECDNTATTGTGGTDVRPAFSASEGQPFVSAPKNTVVGRVLRAAHRNQLRML